MNKLAVVITHPIQYYAPVFRLLTERGRVQVRVFYTKSREAVAFDPGFGQTVTWDIPLLEGYDYRFTGSAKADLFAAIDAYAPQAILVFGWNPPGHLAVMRHYKGRIPVWFRGDSTLLDERPGPRQWARRLFLRRVYRHVDRAFYVGTQNKRYFRAHGLREEQLVFAPHAVDNERFADGPGKDYEQRARAWRKELGIGEQDFAVLFAGKLEPKKNPMLLLDAVATINQTRNPPLHLIYAGSGPLEAMLKDKSRDFPWVHFIGFQNQQIIPVVYRLGNVFCLPSQGPGETWGLAINEAMACTIPVLASDCCGCSVDLVHDNVSGYIFRSNSLEDIISKVLKMLDNGLDIFQSESCRLISFWTFKSQCEAIEKEANSLH